MALNSGKPKSNLAAFKHLKEISDVVQALINSAEIKYVRTGSSEVRYAGGHIIFVHSIADINAAAGPVAGIFPGQQTGTLTPIPQPLPTAGNPGVAPPG